MRISSELYPSGHAELVVEQYGEALEESPKRETSTPLCLVHIPKTGGLGLRPYSAVSAKGHPTLLQLQKRHGRKLKRMHKLAVVRDPWERLRSIQGYMASGGYFGDVSDSARDAARKPPREFIAGLEELVAQEDPVWLRPQADFLVGADGQIGVDEIVPYQRYGEAIPRVLARLGIAYSAGEANGREWNGPRTKVNSTPAKWRVTGVPYTPAERKAVRRMYAMDLRLYDRVRSSGWKRGTDDPSF